jgi:transcriptional regulator with XRE-family HTH domain
MPETSRDLIDYISSPSKKRRTNVSNEEESGDARLYKQTRQSLGDALLRAMAVAAEADDGSPYKVTQDALSQRSGVARSTIAKYVATRKDDSLLTNPDSKTLCRLAHALNVPPALLLMRPEDWRRLAQAATFLNQAVLDPQVQAISSAVAETERGGTAARSMAGLKLAKRLGIYKDSPRAEQTGTPLNADAEALAEAVESMQNRSKLGVMATCALPPLGQMDRQYFAPLLSLCATLGAVTTN